MTTNALSAKPKNDSKILCVFRYIHKHLSYIKDYILDSASTAGVFLAFLFAFNDEPLRYITNNFTCIYVTSVVFALIFFVIKVFVKDEKIGFVCLDSILIIGSIILMWWLINIAIKDDSNDEMKNTNSKTSIATQLSKLEAYQTSHSKELESMNLQIVDLKKKIEELQSKQIIDKVEP